MSSGKCSNVIPMAVPEVSHYIRDMLVELRQLANDAGLSRSMAALHLAELVVVGESPELAGSDVTKVSSAG